MLCMSEDVIATTSASENVYFKFKATDNEDRPFSAETTSSQYLSSRSSGGEEATYSCQFFKLGERMLMRVIGIRPEMIVSVDVRDRMRMDVAAVEMREGVLVRMGVVPYERIDRWRRCHT